MRSPRASEDEAIPDFYVGINHEWADVLADRLENTPLAASLYEAVKPLGRMNIDVKKLEEIIETKLREWDRGGLQKVDGEWPPLPDTYAIEKAVCIHIYTLKHPEVRALANQALESLASRRSFTPIEQGSGGRLEDHLLDACLPFIKYLDVSLDTLPNSYVFKGEVHRRVKWVYPTVEDHKPEVHFKRGALLMWHGFRSASTDRLSVERPAPAGPRTVFTIDAVKAYKIGRFSGGAPLPSSVLFRPLSVFKVADARKNILDPFERKDVVKSGDADAVTLEQIENGRSNRKKPNLTNEQTDQSRTRCLPPCFTSFQSQKSDNANQRTRFSDPKRERRNKYNETRIPPHVVNSKAKGMPTQDEILTVPRPEDVETLVRLLRSRSAHTRERAAAALQSLSGSDEECRKTIPKQGGIPALVIVLRSTNDTAIARESAAGALSNLSVNRKNQKTIASLAAGALPPLVSFLKVGSDTAKENAAAALTNLATNNAENEATIADSGAIPRLVTLLKEGTDVAKRNAASALLELCANSSENRVKIAKAGAIPPLISILTDGIPSAKEEAAGSLLSLAENAENRVEIVKANGVPPLIELLSSGTVTAKEHASGALWNLAVDNDENKEKIAESGAIPMLLEVKKSGSIIGKENASSALDSLALCWENKKRIENQPGVRQHSGSTLDISAS
uniref:U-box domain-containing protein n=1 Tax=Chromera velia CCMP2878 TaxID=1169474 RepID=A0A0G4HDV7_9ALVE|eukprot:Cvel_6493.t1-p1 / transcript=Cvel_6493.t1 / gene=Cvel_6493 / organism=Chromera_velia_CCMP2878 / gene_product=U-box domain-containing protein 4, putative / transcript_product=U-box domain-containing protein 4, putative / location=Cvel_scaffold318:64074-66691(-) / protein_length=678 / sequence_SO=supercontig / SO=protein_coding / is_pseudo=false